jgi:hypothetical protein
MTRAIRILSCVVLFCPCIKTPAQTPSPQDIAQTVSTLWLSQNFPELNSYIINLYASYPTYVPAVLASAFHDCVFLGKLSCALDKFTRVHGDMNNQQDVTVEFKDLLSELQSETKREIKLHDRMGISPAALEANASPQTVRTVWGTKLPPHINILFYAPAKNTL